MGYKDNPLRQESVTRAFVVTAKTRISRTVSAPNGIRIRVSGLKGRRPGPLDDGGTMYAACKPIRLYRYGGSRLRDHHSILTSQLLQSRQCLYYCIVPGFFLWKAGRTCLQLNSPALERGKKNKISITQGTLQTTDPSIFPRTSAETKPPYTSQRIISLVYCNG